MKVISACRCRHGDAFGSARVAGGSTRSLKRPRKCPQRAAQENFFMQTPPVTTATTPSGLLTEPQIEKPQEWRIRTFWPQGFHATKL